VRHGRILPVLLVCGVLLAFLGCRFDEVEAHHLAGDYVGLCGSDDVFVVREDETQRVELRGKKTVVFPYYDAAVLPGGDLLLSSRSQGLVRRTASGEIRQLLPPNILVGSIWLSHSGQYVAFSWPLAWDGSEVTWRGVGIYDLDVGESRLLLSNEAAETRVFGWLGDCVVFWWNSGKAPGFRTVDLQGQEQPLADCPANVNRFLRMRGGFLPFETTDGSLGVLDFATLEIRYVAGVTQAHWVKAGLEALRGERWEIVVETGSE
jgi:hypothetical protein